jgi:4-hydroxybenzoate polyprenyltransferase
MVPPILNLWSSSNALDISDMDEDRDSNINTLPVVFGESNARIASVAASVVSLAAHASSPNFGTARDVIFQIQNLGAGASLISKRPIDFRKVPKLRL